MKRLTPFLIALGLLAADPWQTKPFDEWTSKDIQKLLTNSPWARTISVGGGPAMNSDSGLQGRDTPGSRPGGLDVGGSPPVLGPGDPADQDLSRSRRAADGADPLSDPSRNLTVVWQSALPVKQVIARRKYGADAATSPEARKFLDDNSAYVIAVSGLPPALVQASQGKAALIQHTTLAAKDKPLLHPSDVQFSPAGKLVQVAFVFPRQTAFTMDDKEVEFSTQFGATTVKYKFHLKDMLFHGKLEL